MRVLMVHNYYQQPGGEDEAFEAERRLLRDRGHTVLDYCAHNASISRSDNIRTAIETVWSSRTHTTLTGLLASFRPDIAHFHNTFPLVSPSAYYACRRAHVPVVQTLHNYRLGCPKATYYRNGHLCTDCHGKVLPWPGVVHACYRASRGATGVVGLMNSFHRVLRTWDRQVNEYIALSEFVRRRLVVDGLPAAKVKVKPNFLATDPGPGLHQERGALFVGRLTAEKGIATLLGAARLLQGRVPLTIVGDGPLAGMVDAASRTVPGVRWLGRRPKSEVLELMGQSMALVFPSEWFEPFGLVAIEAFAKGTPVVGAAIGAIPEIVDDGRTGLLYPPGAPDALATHLERLAVTPRLADELGYGARARFEALYTADRNYAALLDIYEPLIQERADVNR
jgi:glycosyltransferase involved in cell wall biosynthesis